MLKGYDDIKQHEKKLKHVNNIIRDIALKNPNITPITTKDYELFEEFFAKEEKHTYGNSWIYITQGAFGVGPENLGYKYYDGKNLCALAIYPKIEQPDITMIHWIRPMGENILSIIVDLAEKIKQEYGVYFYVKKLFPNQYEFLLRYGFGSINNFPWHSSAHSEDDTYPELIYDRKKIMQYLAHPTNATQLGRTLKEVKRFKRENKVEVIEDKFTEHAWNIVNTYFRSRKNFSDKLNVSSSLDYYNMIFSDYIKNKNLKKMILLVNDEPVGFYALMHDKKFDVISIYSYITLRQHYKYLTDLLKLHVFETENARYINSGGSEDEGIHNFKKKYLPSCENKMYWATNYSTKGGNEFQTN